MKNLYLDTLNYDLTVQDFNLRFTSDLTEYVSQKIENVLSTFTNEWFLDDTIGIPYYDRILIKQADINDVNNIILTAINGITEIIEVLSFDVSFDSATRTYSMDFKIVASDGTDAVTIEGTLPIGGR